MSPGACMSMVVKCKGVITRLTREAHLSAEVLSDDDTEATCTLDVLMLHACTSFNMMAVSNSLLCNLLDLFRVNLCRYEGLGGVVYARLHLLQRVLHIVPAGVDPGHALRTGEKACYTHTEPGNLVPQEIILMTESSLRCWLSMSSINIQQYVGCCNDLLWRRDALFHQDLVSLCRCHGK